jgi:hypothetical protein
MVEGKVNVAKAEVQRLLGAGFIREVKYPQWLANVVMVRKKNRKWWMCTDLIDLNKWCPKDNFPFTRIDQIVDTIAGNETMTLLDCFSGYHQIWLHKEDKEKTNFEGHIITSEWTKVFAMAVQHSVEWWRHLWRIKWAEICYLM